MAQTISFTKNLTWIDDDMELILLSLTQYSSNCIVTSITHHFKIWTPI